MSYENDSEVHIAIIIVTFAVGVAMLKSNEKEKEIEKLHDEVIQYETN